MVSKKPKPSTSPLTDIPDKIIQIPNTEYFSIGTKEGHQKITIGLAETGSHLTITNNSNRRTINAHITYDNPSRRPDYLCEFTYYTWARLIVQ